MYYVSHKVTKSSAVVAVTLACILFISSFYGLASAANTHSIDLERGSSQYLSISDGSQTGLDLNSDFTFEAWLKFESLPSTNEAYDIIVKNSGGNNRAYAFLYYDNEGTKELRLSVAADGAVGPPNLHINYNFATGTWTHVAATYDLSAGTAKFYINGVQSGGDQTGGDTAINNSTDPFKIGADIGGASAFDGLIDDVRVWNTERTATEIDDSYNSELNGNETGLVGYWKLNNDSAVDYTANSNNLVNNNSAIYSSNTPFAGFVEYLKARKSTNESVPSSTVLQNDDHLRLSLDANKTYIIDGVIFASSTNANRDLNASFVSPSNSVIRLGLNSTTNDNAVLLSGTASGRLEVPNGSVSIQVSGTVKTSATSGDLQLKWAQFSSGSDPITVMEGSYLRAEAI